MQTMAWILDEYSKFHGYSPAVVTGKPIVSTVSGFYTSFYWSLQGHDEIMLENN